MRSVRFRWQTARRLLVCVAACALGLSSARSHDDIVRCECGHGFGYACGLDQHARVAHKARLVGIPTPHLVAEEKNQHHDLIPITFGLGSVSTTSGSVNTTHATLNATQTKSKPYHNDITPSFPLSLSLARSLSLSLSLWPIATSCSGRPGSGAARTAPHFRRYFCCTYSAPCFDWATLNVTPSLTRPGTWRQKEMWGTVSMPSRPNLYLLMPMPTPR